MRKVPLDAVLLLLFTGRAGAHGPPPEMQLTLASLQAPKLGRAPGIPDERFAWDSREFLRKKCIGKQVREKNTIPCFSPPAVPFDLGV